MQPDSTNGHQRVMVIDDDADVRESLEMALDLEGFSVATACHGRDALDQLAAGPRPDVILVDLMMPVMNGFEFLDVVRADDSLSSIPVVVLSGDMKAREHAAARGARDCLAKPVDLGHLADALRHPTGDRPTPAAHARA